MYENFLMKLKQDTCTREMFVLYVLNTFLHSVDLVQIV